MIELIDDRLIFTFPEVHPDAKLTIEFQRTLRIPDDGKNYPLPPGMGKFPLMHVDDFAENVPRKWLEHGGVMLPMYQSEALWVNFQSAYIVNQGEYPFAVKIAAGKINAVTGKPWKDELKKRPQDYMVSSEQPWLDGYCVKKGIIRQFVAMPLGSGYSAEEQISGEAEHGGIQIIVYPMKRSAFEKYFPVKASQVHEGHVYYSLNSSSVSYSADNSEMGLAPGGQMNQEIYKDPFKLDDWETDVYSRCFTHIANSLIWQSITNSTPPTVQFTAKQYTENGLPWFEFYSEGSQPLDGSEVLNGLKSISEMAKEKKDTPLPENESIEPSKIKKIYKKLTPDQVREGTF